MSSKAPDFKEALEIIVKLMTENYRQTYEAQNAITDVATPDMAKEAANGAPNFDRSVGLRPGDRVVSLGQNPTCLIVATG